MSDPAFSVIIPVYNRWELTKSCLLRLHDTTQGHACEVIVVDNGSSDATPGIAEPFGRTLFADRFRYIRLEENRNFGPACNLGARSAQADLLFFLNNDTLASDGWAEALLPEMQKDQRCAALSPMLLYPDDTVQHIGVVFSIRSPQHLYQNFPRTHPLVQKKRSFQVLSAAALMIVKERFLEVGGFHEAYRNGFEDIDLCLHLVQKGYTLSTVPTSVIYHLESRSQGRKDHERENGRILYARCGNLYRPDLHIHGFRDGLTPYVTDALDVALTLSEKESAVLCSETDGASPEKMEQVVTDNPLWLDGKRRLAERFVREKNPAAAVVVAAALASQSELLRDYRFLLDLEPHAPGEMEHIFREARNEAERLASCTASLSPVRNRMREISGLRDHLLQSLYRKKHAALERALHERSL